MMIYRWRVRSSITGQWHELDQQMTEADARSWQRGNGCDVERIEASGKDVHEYHGDIHRPWS